MKDIHTVYADSILPSLKDTFKNNGIYIMYEHTYENMESNINKAELLMVGELIEGHKDYIKPSFIGKISNIGEFNANYNKDEKHYNIKNLIIKNGDIKKIITSEYLNTISALVLEQETDFNDQKKVINFKNKKRFFIEIEISNNFNKDVFYKKGINHEIVTIFDEQGKLLTKGYKRFFQMEYGIAYDTLKGEFYKNSKKVSLTNGPERTERIKIIMNLLINNLGVSVKKEKILEELGKETESKIDKKNLHTDKEGIEDFFKNHLGINIDDFRKNIMLYSGNNSGYEILGKRVDTIDG